MIRRLLPHVATSAALLALLTCTPSPAQQANPFAHLSRGDTVQGFIADAVYLNESARPIGARFIHAATGFTLDLARIPSVPQSFIWVNSYPTSNMGEPHTQEHLLLGKGNKGRYVASLEEGLLVGSSAFTAQTRTAYHFHTNAGMDAWYTMLDRQLDALLHPDYTDEEIRREVANYGVVEKPDGSLGLEEKGTVYNEMVSSYEHAWSRMSEQLGIATYGPKHPLVLSSGGEPSAIRMLTPVDIRRFHDANYHLANMGMIASLPPAADIPDVLGRVGAILDAVEPGGGLGNHYRTERDLPKPAPMDPGAVIVADYPTGNATQPGPVLMTWPADLSLSRGQRMILSLFLQAFAGDATTQLYKRLVDSRTRAIDIGARSTFSWVDRDQGNPITIGLGGVDPARMTPTGLLAIREQVMTELKRFTELLDASPEIVDFNRRVRNRITETRRSLSNLVNSPPGFGFRGGGGGWMDRIRELDADTSFRKWITDQVLLNEADQALATNRNIWRDLLKTWGMLDREPAIAGARPSPELAAREAQERKDRIASETARLRAAYGAGSDQEALRRYRAEYDAGTSVLDSLANVHTPIPFVANPPMTLDDQLDWSDTVLASGVHAVVARFPDMTSAAAGIAIRLDEVPEDDRLVLLTLLPDLLRNTGITVGPLGMPFEDMTEQLRRDVLGIDIGFSNSHSTDRSELTLRGSGNDLQEAERAIEWMSRMLMSPYWDRRNIGRMRDVVEARLSDLRSTMQGSEESWVNDPAWAIHRQDRPTLLATGSFLTQEFNALRMKWLLRDPGRSGAPLASFLAKLPGIVDRTDRAGLERLLGWLEGDTSRNAAIATTNPDLFADLPTLPLEARKFIPEIAHDLSASLTEIPDGSLAADWKLLTRIIARDIQVDPLAVAARLDTLRRSLLKRGAARVWIVGSPEAITRLSAKLDSVTALFSATSFRPLQRKPTALITDRLTARLSPAERRSTRKRTPLFLGLVSQSSSSGVFVNIAKATNYHQTDTASVLDFLTSMLYGGGGGQGVFMKTWAAGLAYSNGLRISPRSGVITYYAERVPLLPQTMRFVIDVLKDAPLDTTLAEYAIAQAFQESRAAEGFEDRAQAMASDLADGLTPDVVRRFRQAVLAMRGKPNLGRILHDRMPSVYGRVLPGYGPRSSDVKDATFFVIGPEAQLEQYEAYLKKVEGKDARLVRVWPRDFWGGVRGEK